MKKLLVFILVITMVLNFVSCVDYSSLSDVKAEQAMSDEVELQSAELLRENFEQIDKLNSEIETLKQDNDKYVSDNVDLNEKIDKKENEIEGLEKKQAEESKKDVEAARIKEILFDVIYSDSVSGKKTEFIFADMKRIDMDFIQDDRITFDRLDDKVKDIGVNFLSSSDIDDEAFYDESSYTNRVKKDETFKIGSTIYIQKDGKEFTKFDDDVASMFAKIVYISQDKLKTSDYDWYIDKKEVETDFDGNVVEEKNIVILCIIDSEITMIIDLGIKGE